LGAADEYGAGMGDQRVPPSTVAAGSARPIAAMSPIAKRFE
jgi:hypothetical protein